VVKRDVSAKVFQQFLRDLETTLMMVPVLFKLPTECSRDIREKRSPPFAGISLSRPMPPRSYDVSRSGPIRLLNEGPTFS